MRTCGGIVFIFLVVMVVVVIANAILSPASTSNTRREYARPAPPQIEAGSGQQWRARTQRSAMTDFQNQYLSVDAIGTHVGAYGQTVRPTLTLRCVEDTTAVVLDAGEYLGIDTLRVEYRIDEQPAQTGHWGISTDFTAAGLWRGRQAIPFIRRLVAADVGILTVRYIPYGESARTVSFRIDGLDRRIGPLQAMCSWT